MMSYSQYHIPRVFLTKIIPPVRSAWRKNHGNTKYEPCRHARSTLVCIDLDLLKIKSSEHILSSLTGEAEHETAAMNSDAAKEIWKEFI